MIKHLEGEAAIGHPIRNPISAYPTKQKSQIVVSFKHGDPKVEEGPLEPSKNINIIIINTGYLHIKENHERTIKKGRKAHAANTQQRLHFFNKLHQGISTIDKYISSTLSLT